MNEDQKTGLFNSTYQRINGLLPYLEDYNIYSIKSYDGRIYSLLKKLVKKNVVNKEKDFFYYKNLKIKSLYVKNTICSQILKKLGLYHPFIIALKIKKEISNYEMICAHWGFPQGRLAYILSKLLNLPFTVTYHGSDIHTLPLKYKFFFNNIVKTLTNSNLNIFVSNDLMDYSINYLGNTKINSVVIKNTVEIEKYNPVSREEIQKLKKIYNFKDKVVGYVGNLTYVKGVDRLPKIFSYVKSHNKENVDFIVIGDGELSSDLKEQFRKKNLNALFPGKVEPEKINEFMNIIDVLILPSRQESFGLVILEANLCGTLAIGSNTGGIPEALENSDLLIDDNFEFEYKMSEKIIEFLRKGYEKDFLRERVIKNFNPQVGYATEYKLLNNIYKNKKISR
ncbi:glycosyltransferase family 4 protein [Fictibacillus sp. S7]|uniref:glycosyltransferase family 4 protein n=1 Tax=Fictibacillus sp. S7 TaxID=2212476 RepID=UPI0019D6BAF1|nr:glycosyltransferase family 4 protein [Fictibacillus sp. S7]